MLKCLGICVVVFGVFGTASCGSDETAIDGRPSLIRYALSEGSKISYASPSETHGRMGPEPLSGTFDLAEHRGVAIPNVYFDLDIRALMLRSNNFEVQADSGRVTAHTVISPPLTFRTEARINGQMVNVEGRGSEETFTAHPAPPSFQGVTLEGGGYTIVIFAAPQ